MLTTNGYIQGIVAAEAQFDRLGHPVISKSVNGVVIACMFGVEKNDNLEGGVLSLSYEVHIPSSVAFDYDRAILYDANHKEIGKMAVRSIVSASILGHKRIFLDNPTICDGNQA